MKLPTRLLNEARHAQNSFFLTIACGLMAGIFGIIQARVMSKLLDLVFLQGKGLAAVAGILLTLLGTIFLRFGLTWGSDLSASAGARRIKENLRKRLYSHILDLGPAFIRGQAGEADVRTGELVNTATEGVEALEVFFGQYLPQIALAVLTPLTILIFVFRSDLVSGVVMLVTAPLIPLFMYLIGSAADTLTRKQWQGLSRMSAYFLDILQGLSTLKSLGRSRDQVPVIKKVSEQYRQTTMSVLRVTFLSAMVLEMIATLSTAVIAIEIGIRLLYGKMAFEQAFFVLLLAPEFYLPLRLLGIRFHTAMSGVEASKRIFTLLDLPASQHSLSLTNEAVSSHKHAAPPSIVLKDVSYTYANKDPALQGISIEIPAGKKTALLGESGAGKTTLSWLLLGFLQPEGGEILVDGRNLSDIPLSEWHSQLAWVPQNPYLFNDTIAANIRISRPEASDTDIRKAAQLAYADEFIDDLPQGYATLIGERGLRLSAGQAQRIALARAFLKDAPLLILDEATSHLDPVLDAQFQDSLTRLGRHRTVFMIAHHRSSLSRADQVIKLSHGQVVHAQVGEAIDIPLQSPGKRLSPRMIARSRYKSDEPVSRSKSREVISPKEPSLFLRMVNLLTPFTGRILLSVFLGFATIASSVGLMTTAAYIISAAALHPSIADLSMAIVGVRFFGISRGIFRYLERLVSHDVTFRLLANWRVWFYQALEPLAPARLLQYHSGDLLSRVISDIGTLESYYVRTLAPPLVALFVAIAMCVFIGGFGSLFMWVLLGFLMLAGIGLPLAVILSTQHTGFQLIQARAQVSARMVDGIQGMPDILASGHAETFYRRVEESVDDLTRLHRRMAIIATLQNAASNLLANLCMLVVLIVGIQWVSYGLLSGVMLGAVALGALMTFEAVSPLPTVALNLETNLQAARRLYELVDTQPVVLDPIQPISSPQNAHLEVSNLSFQYPRWADDAGSREISSFSLDKISFLVPEGKHIAIIGPSGAGKTTLVNILQRFWDYQNGSIRWGGNELRDYRQEDVQRHIGVIAQDTYLFTATIRDNLRIARLEASNDEIIQAAREAKLHDLILSLPDGYDTWIGEHGLHLSAGERQRLSIARTLLKDAPLLILDEPTANLDPVTELEVLLSIRKFSHGRSTISISQHMVGLESMDEILVLQDGRIIEHGSHAELLSQNGLYHRMWLLYNQAL